MDVVLQQATDPNAALQQSLGLTTQALYHKLFRSESEKLGHFEYSNESSMFFAKDCVSTI